MATTYKQKRAPSKKARAKAITAKSKARRKPPVKRAQKRSAESSSKVDVATAIFKKMKGKQRKDVIAAFMSEAGLTSAGAATYYSNIKKKLS